MRASLSSSLKQWVGRTARVISGVLPMKLIFRIALVLSLLMLGDGAALGVIIALLFAIAVWLALSLLDALSEMMERGTQAH